MRFLPSDEVVVLYETVFDDPDLFERKKISATLSSVVDLIEDPLVVALDGQWGTGKSYFLKRWVGAHSKQNGGRARTVYFDAFANDYHSDPLVGLIAAISEHLEKKESSTFSNLRKRAAPFVKPVARILAAVTTAGVSEAAGALGDAALQVLKADADKAIEAFWQNESSRSAAMNAFQLALGELTRPKNGESPIPLVIVVDELDRCRPDYALELLEVAKHFFSVEHVHFVLGVNLNALENSVRVRYGNGIDANLYLSKFINLNISLPYKLSNQDKIPVIVSYAQIFGNKMGISDQIISELKSQLLIFSKNNHISIRDVGKMLSLLSLMPKHVRTQKKLNGWVAIAVSLIITKIIKPDYLRKIAENSLTEDEFFLYFVKDKRMLVRNLGNNERNEYFDLQLTILVCMWSYIRGDIDKYSPEESLKGHVLASFDNFGRLDRPETVAQEIYDDWLSIIDLS